MHQALGLGQFGKGLGEACAASFKAGDHTMTDQHADIAARPGFGQAGAATVAAADAAADASAEVADSTDDAADKAKHAAEDAVEDIKDASTKVATDAKTAVRNIAASRNNGSDKNTGA